MNRHLRPGGIAAPGPPGEVATLLLRTHAWAEGGEERFLLVAGSAHATLALAFAHLPGEGRHLFGMAISGPEAVRAEAGEVFARVRPRPAGRLALVRAGLIDGGALPLLLALQTFAFHDPRPGGSAPFPVRSVTPYRTPFQGAFDRAGFREPVPARHLMAALRSGTPRFEPPPDAGVRPVRIRVTRQQAMFAAFDLPEMSCEPADIADRLARESADLCAPVLAFARSVSERLRPGGIALSNATWSPRLHAWLAAPGEAGRRRIQAARLHPGLAPLLAHGGVRLGRAIDAGRPHEGLLDAALARLAFRCGGDPYGPARMRRLRALPDGLHPGYLPLLLIGAHHLRADRLPGTEAGWLAFADQGIPIIADAFALGLDPDRLACGPGVPWLDPAAEAEAGRLRGRLATFDRGNDEPPPTVAAMAGARDMAASLTETLLGHLPNGPRRAAADPGRGPDLVPAGRILFGGRRLREVVALSDRWHAGMADFLRALPQRDPNATWPALFDPVEGPGGVRLACLSDAAALREEGADGDGLSHCVATYVPACLSGRSHIVSVREELTDGGVVRLSTVEIENDGENGIRFVQHRGAGNGPPPQRAVTAVRFLVDAIQGGAVRLAPEALAIRAAPNGEPAPDAEALGQVFAAWRPYLPPGIARRGIEGLAALVAGVDRDA